MSILIAGASLAGLSAAESLRKVGYDDEIIVVDPSPELPSDRPPLSKQVLSGQWPPEKAAQRAAGHLAEWNLDLRLGVGAESLDLEPLKVHLSDGSSVSPNGLIVATGSRPRRIGDGPVSGVHFLRDLDDCLALKADLDLEPDRVVVVGAGFIGAEVAATCRGLGLEVTMLEAAKSPLIRVLPGEVGDFITDLHRDNGTEVRLGVGVDALVTNETPSGPRVRAVRLADGTTIDASVVVVGIGVQPNVEWLEGSGLRVDNGVHCDETCLAAPGVVASGDAANWLNQRYGRRMRVEQWEHAIEQGEYVAKRLLQNIGWQGADASDEDSATAVQPFAPVPWFWSDQYDKKIQMAGLPDATDEIVLVEGSMEERRFVVLFKRGDICSAVLGVNRPRHVMQARMKMDDSLDWAGVISLFG